MNHLDFDDDGDSIVLIEEDKVEMQAGGVLAWQKNKKALDYQRLIRVFWRKR